MPFLPTTSFCHRTIGINKCFWKRHICFLTKNYFFAFNSLTFVMIRYSLCNMVEFYNFVFHVRGRLSVEQKRKTCVKEKILKYFFGLSIHQLGNTQDEGFMYLRLTNWMKILFFLLNFYNTFIVCNKSYIKIISSRPFALNK